MMEHCAWHLRLQLQLGGSPTTTLNLKTRIFEIEVSLDASSRFVA